ncbi:glutamate--tRNA ligase [Gilvibacter sp.]|uniref:glutamate--tRNA ligase n=1 Tax=Gilvibacter sp. TaxID=2729997 RepID=UPI0025B7FF8A|nr:glutamate--tRNA ligase [Gilvibacter sp.]NQX76667.1 glutamate--tRNA ligase [Gilvibacter sp.]
MSCSVRVRFAPSPTGPLHIGGVRTALFNYLFAKKQGGTFVLRIEDTDQTRYVPGAEDYIIEALNWLNIPFDEGPGKDGGFGPYRQSERKASYKQYADQLIQAGHAYYAFDTPEALTELRAAAEANKETFSYGWANRDGLDNSLNMSDEDLHARLNSGIPYVIRFKTPADETLTLQDVIRGEVKVHTSTLDDKVLFKSDGMPTYHLANIVDDHLMEITHVIRGEEWLPSLALHYLLYRSMGWDAPEFAHLPLIMKPVGKGKLSKRDGDKMGFPVFPLQWNPQEGDASAGYREDGYLPEAAVNMLAFLGWNPGTEQEIFSLEELVEAFDLSRVNKAGAKFDPEKTKWFQTHYIQQRTDADLAAEFGHLLVTKNISSRLNMPAIVGALKERITFTEDLWELGHYFFVAPDSYDAKASKKAFKEETPELMSKVVELLNGVDDFTAENASKAVKTWIQSLELGFGKVMMPLRLSLVGSLQGPDVFDIMEILGKVESVRRIENAIAHMS